MEYSTKNSTHWLTDRHSIYRGREPLRGRGLKIPQKIPQTDWLSQSLSDTPPIEAANRYATRPKKYQKVSNSAQYVLKSGFKKCQKNIQMYLGQSLQTLLLEK